MKKINKTVIGFSAGSFLMVGGISLFIQIVIDQVDIESLIGVGTIAGISSHLVGVSMKM